MIEIVAESVIIKYQCQFCLRHNFDRPLPHRCAGGFRKRNIIWQKYYTPERVVMIEKGSHTNSYKNIMKNVLKIYSKNSFPLT